MSTFRTVTRTLRLSQSASRRLAARAAREGTTSAALLDRLIREGVDQLDHPGIIFRGPMSDRRAALVAGPDVWEVVARLQELDGPVERRIEVLSARSSLHAGKIKIAIAYARDHGGEIIERIGRNRAAAEVIRRATPPRAPAVDREHLSLVTPLPE
ncbi:hypothetical protein [Nocardia brasiliensis]|uniref:hypothetical protein n=1 Tax=Nocardia brasiliensis TaxID=37326 RepID=UPI001E5713FF|nr:hypothetical protein [Nocardia brasiliensis]